MIFFAAWRAFLLVAALRFQDGGPAGANSDFSSMRQRADAFYAEGKYLEALPLYTELERRDPTQAVFPERRAAGLIAKSATQPQISQQLALQREAYSELLHAKGMGDSSAYVETMLAKLNELFAAGAAASLKNDLAALMKRGLAAMGGRKYEQALQYFTAAWQGDENSYDAALYAGQAEICLHDLTAAANWFSKASSVNPSRDTAYLCLGDALLSDNQVQAARERFVDAVVAWPYARTSWDGLQRWADRANVHLSSPRLIRPAATSPLDPNARTEDGTGRSVWILYLVERSNYRNALFREKFPKEPRYRHTLAEEADSLRQAAEALKVKQIPPAKLDPNLGILLRLYLSNMLEPWILFHGADDGIVQDYPAYRDAHRDQLRAYLNQYDIHSAP